MRIRAAGLVAILALASLPGCAGFAQHRGEPLAGWPPPAGPKPLTVHLLSVVPAGSGGAQVTAPLASPERNVPDGVRRAWASCPGLRVVEGGAQGWDRRVVTQVATRTKDEGTTAATAVLCGFTLMLVPAVITFDLQMTATVYDAEGRELGVFYQRGDQSDWFMSWLLLFVWPFFPTEEAYEDEVYELARRVILEAKGAGIL
jgi:hypothetical protein